jgi:hypothetical protein
MRRVFRSRTAIDGLQILLTQGLPKFGKRVIAEKKSLVDAAIDQYLAESPHRGLRDADRSFCYYPVSDTPFTVVYEYDETDLRILFIVHSRADRRRLDPADVEW